MRTYNETTIDAVGNRVWQDYNVSGPVITSFAYNASNAVTFSYATGSSNLLTTYAYDAAGALTTYSWDYEKTVIPHSVQRSRRVDCVDVIVGA